MPLCQPLDGGPAKTQLFFRPWLFWRVEAACVLDERAAASGKLTKDPECPTMGHTVAILPFR